MPGRYLEDNPEIAEEVKQRIMEKINGKPDTRCEASAGEE